MIVHPVLPLAGPLTQSNMDNIVFVRARRSLKPKKPKYTKCFARLTTCKDSFLVIMQIRDIV